MTQGMKEKYRKQRNRGELLVRTAAFLFLAFLAAAIPVQAQTQEVGLTIGGLLSPDRSFRSPNTGTVTTASGVSLGADYAHRLVGGRVAALYAEFEFVANARDRQARSATAAVPATYATLYLAPGLRIKFRPESRFSPWAAFGGGYAQYEQAKLLTDGQAFDDHRIPRGVFDFGVGADYRLWRFVSLRGEIRDYVSGNPALNVALDSSLQHNILPKGGVVFNF